MAYAIMRAKKLATLGGVAASLQHNFRERETANADPDRTRLNEHLRARSTDEAMGRLRDLLPEKRRKDAVLMVEYVMTASPEWWKSASQSQQQAFFERSMQWLADKYGAQNVTVATIQRDEKSPHLSAFVVPLTSDKRLSAKEFIGNRDKMRADQTSFAEVVRDLDLVRGIEGSKAKHQRVQQHYGQLERMPVEVAQIRAEHLTPKVLEKGFLRSTVESPAMVAERVSKLFAQHYRPALEQASIATQETRRAREMAQTAHAKGEAQKTTQKALEAAQQKFNDVMRLIAIGGLAFEKVQHQARQILAKAIDRSRDKVIERDRGRSR